MAQKTWATDDSHPALVEWLGRHQGEELQTLTATYKAAAGRLDGHLGRRTEAEARLAEIDTLLVDAVGKERANLLTKRTEVAADLDSLPSQLATLRERHKQAHIAFLSKVAELARAESEGLQAQIVGPWVGVVEARKQITAIDASYNQGSTEQEVARAALFEEDRKRVGDVRPLIEARDAARQVQKVAEVLASNAYGEGVNLHQARTWGTAVPQAVSA